MNIRRVLATAGAAVVLSSVAVFLPPSANAAPAAVDETPSVGIWYATWYQKLPNVDGVWIDHFGAGAENQFLADVNGDGRDDAVTFDRETGKWTVATLNGQIFGAPSVWLDGHGAGSDSQYMADVNGDGRDDAIIFFNSPVTGVGGEWYVALSTGSSFTNMGRWMEGAGVGTLSRDLADVNGDGKADICVFGTGNGRDGAWNCALSTGSAFGPSQPTWGTFGADDLYSLGYMLGDMNADGKADAVFYDKARGSIWQMLSTGSSFTGGTSNPLATGSVPAGAERYWVDDGNGDGYGDVFLWEATDGVLTTVEYNRAWDRLADVSTLRTGYADMSTPILTGDVIDDKYGWKSVVAVMPADGGSWLVQRLATATTNVNTWAGFGVGGAINYVPMQTQDGQPTNTFAQYDSGDPAVLAEHLTMFEQAEIDWLLMDETNNLNVDHGEILNRARDAAVALSERNETAEHKIRYAFAVGGIQFSGDPAVLEAEAKQTWQEFANDPEIGGDNYYMLDGKPLLVVFCGGAQFDAWQAYGDHQWTDHFTVRHSSGDGGQTGFYGWNLPQSGTTGNDEAMGVMPGWNNHIDPNVYPPVLRHEGRYYAENCWEKILAMSDKPRQVVINSFNEFAEDTGVEPVDSSAYAANRDYAQGYSLREPWYNSAGQLDPTMYWDMTVDYIHQLKHPNGV